MRQRVFAVLLLVGTYALCATLADLRQPVSLPALPPVEAVTTKLPSSREVPKALRTTVRTLKFASEFVDSWSWPPTRIDVLLTVERPSGEHQLAWPVRQIPVLKARSIEGKDRKCYQFLTLQLTAAQVEALKKAQSQGTLDWVSGPPGDESVNKTVTVNLRELHTPSETP